MEKIFYQPENAWMGDFIPYYENGTYYLYYLHDPRVKPLEYAEETTWHLITTKDFLHYENCGEAIARGGKDERNRNIYTGSVLRDPNGLCTAFYTAYNADFKTDGRSVQSVMMAQGQTPETLRTVENFYMVADGDLYEPFDWRDPYVFYSGEDHCYYMLLAARLSGSGERRGGCIAMCKSQDMKTWTTCKPFYAPNQYITMECPEVFQMGDWWYLVFSTFSDRFTTHYRKAKSLHGPWLIPKDDVFDGRANYAIKTASDGKRRFAFGWIASRAGETDFGPWEWGGDMHVHEVVQDENGDLRCKELDTMVHRFSSVELSTPSSPFGDAARTEDGWRLHAEGFGALQSPVPDTFRLEMTVKPESDCEFGLAVNTDEQLEKGYFLRLKDGWMALDLWPRIPSPGMYQWQINGDHPFQIETMRFVPTADTYRILVLREGNLLAVYVNDRTALSTRAYNHRSGYAGVYVIGGGIRVCKWNLQTR